MSVALEKRVIMKIKVFIYMSTVFSIFLNLVLLHRQIVIFLPMIDVLTLSPLVLVTLLVTLPPIIHFLPPHLPLSTPLPP